MAGITGLGTTFNLPNFVGEVFGITPEDTPLLSAIGGLTGGEQTFSTRFEWQFYDLRDADAARQRTEGADAPTAEERVRANGHNVVEIHQESVAVSYTRLAATQLLATGGRSAGSNPITNEYAWQIEAALKQIARDIELSFITGTFQEPADNTTPRKTRGLLAAITTNVVVAPVAPGNDLTEAMLLDMMQLAWTNGGLQESETRTIMTGAFQRRALTKIFITDKNYREETRNVGGVSLSTIETDFGRANIMLNRHMPADQVVAASLEDLAPVFLNIPGKGFLFVEPLAKTGAREESQIYGEVGLKYGNERKHAKITGLSTS